MEKYAINKKMLRQLHLMNNHRKPSQEVLDSLIAQIFLELSIYNFHKTYLQSQIDNALKHRNKEEFNRLVEIYNTFIENYKDGIQLSEQGFTYTIELDE